MDICLCLDHRCPIRETCVRYKGEPDKIGQIYFLDSPFDYITNTCNQYKEITKDTPLTIQDEQKEFYSTIEGILFNNRKREMVINMKTPAEKAKELLDTYKETLHLDISIEENRFTILRCTFICAQQIKANARENKYWSNYEYWEKVLMELAKLRV